MPCGTSTNASPHTANNPLSGNTDDPIANNELADDRPLIDNDAVYDRSQPRIKSMENRPQTIEVWFAGTHSDM